MLKNKSQAFFNIQKHGDELLNVMENSKNAQK